MPAPAGTPTGLALARTARSVSRAFDDALAAAGGSVPVWLVLISLKSGHPRNQRELADAVGIREATLTHHLNTMDAQGLLTRRRDPANRRVHLVELTDDGEAAFQRLRGAAVAFDQQLRRGLNADDVACLHDLLGRLAANAAGETSSAEANEARGGTAREGGGGTASEAEANEAKGGAARGSR